jgi:hypothetical protein
MVNVLWHSLATVPALEKNMKAWGGLLIGVVVAGVLAYGLFMMLNNMIPPGVAPTVTAEKWNDPSDLTPREPALPKGPHQDEFVFNCTACHSPRLTLTQPNFPASKWTEVVKKMVTVYGAKIDAPTEEQIVKYLAAVKGVK